jgi:hypothetical protein
LVEGRHQSTFAGSSRNLLLHLQELIEGSRFGERAVVAGIQGLKGLHTSVFRNDSFLARPLGIRSEGPSISTAGPRVSRILLGSGHFCHLRVADEASRRIQGLSASELRAVFCPSLGSSRIITGYQCYGLRVASGVGNDQFSKNAKKSTKVGGRPRSQTNSFFATPWRGAGRPTEFGRAGPSQWHL